MGENSKIEWTRHTFNPWIGCQKVSPGCDHCYAEAMMADRYGRVIWGPHGDRSRTSPGNWRKPRQWDRAAAAAGERHRVFCASLADVFDNHRSILPEWRADLWSLIRETQNLDWLLLTKRPQNIAKMLPADWGDGWQHVWLGTTVENQDEADRRIPHLRAVPAKVRFLSAEPLVEMTVPDLRGIAWVIVGGESGRCARKLNPFWARILRDQCASEQVAFFMKQMGGERKPFDPIPDDILIREFPHA